MEGRQGNSEEGKMSFSPVVLLHITAGTWGMLSGSVAIFLRKGSRQHGLAGNVCPINADPVRKRRVPGVNEIPTGQCSGRHSNVLSGNNGMDDRQAQGWGNQHF